MIPDPRAVARRWWAGDLGPAGTVLDVSLTPAEALFRLAVRARGAAFDRGVLRVHRAGVPVISVGNVAVGGTGKTPFSSWVAGQLQRRGRQPAILHGGYADDEPALHRRWRPDVPVVVERDRVAGAARAEAAGADVLVLDDAFQHRRLHRDLDIVLVAAERWSARPRLLPRGPWREPPAALRRADLVVVSRKTAEPAQRDRVVEDLHRLGCTTAAVHLRPAGWVAAGAAAGSAPEGACVVVCGVAEPGLVAGSARAAGAVVDEMLAFADHHSYGPGDVAAILGAAAGRAIVTTEKDWTKLEAALAEQPVWLLTQEVVIEQGAAELQSAFDRILS